MANEDNNFLPLLPIISSSMTQAPVVRSEDSITSIHQLVQDQITLWQWCHARAEALRAKIPVLKAGSDPDTLALGYAVAKVERHIVKAQQDAQPTVDKLSSNERIILEKVDKAIGEQIRGDWLSMHAQFKNAGLPCPVCVGGYYYGSVLEPNDCMLNRAMKEDEGACPVYIGSQNWLRADESRAWKAGRKPNEDEVEGGSQKRKSAWEGEEGKSGKMPKQF